MCVFPEDFRLKKTAMNRLVERAGGGGWVGGRDKLQRIEEGLLGWDICLRMGLVCQEPRFSIGVPL